MLPLAHNKRNSGSMLAVSLGSLDFCFPESYLPVYAHLYSRTSEERTLWEQRFCPLFGGCPYLGGSVHLCHKINLKCIT